MSPLWEGRDADRAYVCQGYACQMPATTPAERGSASSCGEGSQRWPFAQALMAAL